jgi:transcriptional regulator with XRE-family HTH domain
VRTTVSKLDRMVRPNDTKQHRGKRIRAARSYAGITERTLGQAVGATEGQIKSWGRGTGTPNDATLEAIAERCAVPASFLLYGWPKEPWGEDLSADGEADHPSMGERVAALEILVRPLVSALGQLDPNALVAIQRALAPEA